MINPTQYPAYPDYVAACKVEAEIPAPESVWRGWSVPPLPTPAPGILHASPSAYLNWLVEQLPDLKFGAHEGDPVAEILWNVIRELRSQDERLRGIEKALLDQEAGK